MPLRFEYGVEIQSKIIKTGRGIAVMPLLSLLSDLTIESSFGHILMGGELGNKACTDVPLRPLALFPPMFNLIGTPIFMRIHCGKVGAFDFSRIPRRDRVGEKTKRRIFHMIILVFGICSVGSGLLALPIWKS